ncbi:hypothetical protein AYL99_00179 [Fonsecaea erecta]|uniref:Transcription factor domain-containing protein n=1 Tax=Fonsecaea erecta TaxID=1367422 RepID=A0A178ZWY7_9EURO|nr:hypothetical protein AYL99_00179 [Fonsecaea erecta]OAP64207.1 hypothetical protein AYL99_00179 [Fonsecaea erecta]
MAVELGVTQGPANITQHEMILASPGEPVPAEPSSASQNCHTKSWSLDLKRAYIGAFVISILKPSKLINKQYLNECAASLVADPQYPSDETLLHVVRSLQISELTSDLFDHGSKEKLCGFNDEQVQIFVNTLSRQLEESKAALPPSLRSLGYIVRQFYIGRAYIHEVGLYGNIQGQPLSLTRMSIICECLSSASRYLSHVLDCSLEHMADWTCSDWRSINFIVMLSTKCSIILNSNPSWATSDTSQRAAWLDKCIDTLCSRLNEFQSLAPAGLNYYEGNHFEKLISNWKDVKAYHQRWIRGISLSEAAPTDSEYSDIFSISSFWGFQGQGIDV